MENDGIDSKEQHMGNTTKAGKAVTQVREQPSRKRAPSVREAREQHRAEGFTRYAGPKLSGPRTVLEHGEEGYPDALMTVQSPPKRLFVIGNAEALHDGLAIVGARMATPYGLSCARTFAKLAADAGVCVVSGGARGCDAQAHRGALEAGGRTVVVLGSGCDELYPAEHYALFQDVIDAGGAVVSEQEWGFPPMRYAFRARNRIIAGLTRATLVVEAGMPSGTFSTADAALSAGRDVLAVPGAITSKTSRGCNRLISQGAVPIVDDETFRDVLFSTFGILKQEFAPAPASADDAVPGGKDEDGASPSDAKAVLLEALQACPATPERLTALSASGSLRLTRSQIACALVDLQRAGLVSRYPDGRYGPARL